MAVGDGRVLRFVVVACRAGLKRPCSGAGTRLCPDSSFFVSVRAEIYAGMDW